MRYYGDIPPDHVKLVEELKALEAWFRERLDKVPYLFVAKGFVCMAHDYYYLYMDEEAVRLLIAAESLCPGYFIGPIYSHIASDDRFDKIIANLKQTDGIRLMHSLGFGK